MVRQAISLPALWQGKDQGKDQGTDQGTDFLTTALALLLLRPGVQSGVGEVAHTLFDMVDASTQYFCPQNPRGTYNYKIRSFDTQCLLTYLSQILHMSMTTVSKYSMD